MGSLAVASRSFSKHPLLRKEVLSRYPDTKFNDQGLSLQGDPLINFLAGYEMAITALETIDYSILSKLPELKIIGKYGVGLDMIDLDAMNKYNVQLGWKGGVNKRSVSELVISSAIALLHRSVFANAEVRKGKWNQVKGRQLSECTFGIVGCGHIGKDIIRLLQPFNCKILAHDILEFNDFYLQYNVTSVGLNELLETSDVVTLHLPLDNSTKNILNKERLSIMKDTAVLINLARGGLIDEAELKNIILTNKIAGVAMDVFAVEPPSDSDFSTMDNVLITPHIGGSTEEAIFAMGMAAIESLENSKNPLYFKSTSGYR
jgi:phosphoglycerate dehydrogenase-like enzyme